MPLGPYVRSFTQLGKLENRSTLRTVTDIRVVRQLV